MNTELAQQQLCESAAGYAGGGLPSAGAFENITGVLEVVLECAGEVGVTGARASDGFVK
jgi:hypothetical protein